MNFLYEAVDETGLPVFGKVEATDVATAEGLLLSKGLQVQSLAPSGMRLEPTVLLSPSSGTAHVPSGTRTEPTMVLRQTPERTLDPTPSQSISFATQPSHLDRVNTSPVMQELTSIGSVVTIPRYEELSNGERSQVRKPVETASAPRPVSIKLAGNAARMESHLRKSGSTIPQVHARPSTVTEGSPLGGVKTKDLLLCFQQLASLVHSGITLFGALDNLAPRTSNANLKRVLREMADAARNGRFISDVMAGYPRIFEEHVIGLMRAGEHGGFVEIALAEIAETYESTIKFRRNSWIPISMVSQSILLLAFVIPFFPIVFSSLDFAHNIVRYVTVVMTISLPISLAVLGALLAGYRYLQLPRHRLFRDRLALRIPAFGTMQREMAVRSFLRVLRRLYASGVSPVRAWEGAMNTAVNSVIREQLKQSYGLMEGGATLGDAFRATGLFADHVEQMVITGQHSGQVVEMLDQASVIYEQRVHEATGRARFMMLRIGVMIMLVLGGIALIWFTKSYFDSGFKIANDIENGN